MRFFLKNNKVGANPEIGDIYGGLSPDQRRFARW
jgi:hypothetical protein